MSLDRDLLTIFVGQGGKFPNFLFWGHGLHDLFFGLKIIGFILLGKNFTGSSVLSLSDFCVTKYITLSILLMLYVTGI